MQISSRFTIAIHVLVCIEQLHGACKITGDLLASSVNVNPVVIRRLLQQLKSAGLVQVVRGSGGAALAKPPQQITLLDVYRAVDCVADGQLFSFHQNPNPQCPVGRNIHTALDGKLDAVQAAMEGELRTTTLADILAETRKALAAEQQTGQAGNAG